MILLPLESRSVPAVVYATNGAVVIQEAPDTFGVSQILSFVPFDGYAGPISTAVVDQKTTAVGAGSGGGPRVQLWSRAETEYVKVYDDFAFEPSFRGGVNVGLCDWNGDGRADLVVGAGVGGAPRVRVIDGRTFATLDDFFAFEDTFRGGVFIDAYRRHAVVVPGPGGGPRVRLFDTGVQVEDRFITDPTNRTITDYAYGVVGGRERLFALDGTRTLLVCDSGLALERTTTLYHPFAQLGIGDYFNFGSVALSGVSGGAIVSLDEVFGVPLGHADNPKDVQIGSYQILPRSGGPLPPPPPPIVPLSLVSPYQEVTGDPTVFAGRSIGSPSGTLTYTTTVHDVTTGQELGLSNYHGFAGIVPVVTPGRADALEPDRFPLGQVVRLDRSHDADWAVFTVTQPTDPAVRVSYFDGFEGTWKTDVYPAFRYDPAVTMNVGDTVYKVGRTTSFQRAVVQNSDEDVIVGYPDTDVVQHSQVVLDGYGFSRPGDSGSPVFKVVGDDLYLVGQLFAGDGQSRSIVTPITRVFDQAGVVYS